MEKVKAKKVKVNYRKLLDDQLKKVEGGGYHSNLISEYISNSDDSYRRLGKNRNENILVTIKSRRGKMIDELTIEDFAEGMSYNDLENKFFQYFESFSGRERGEKVTGRFGTGGKAYAIMNFRSCWIVSVKNGLECKSWFKYDHKNKEILNGYDGAGYKNKKVDKPNGTKIILEDSKKVNHPLEELVSRLENSARIRHILRTQKVKLRIDRKNEKKEVELNYTGPKEGDAKKIWKFDLTHSLKHSKEDSKLVLRYFENSLGDHSFIDISDGISSVADLLVSKFDGRPYSKYINGALALTILAKSSAVKENRKGLEEGDDLTFEIESFIKQKVGDAINEIESLNRDKEKEARINSTNSKLKELSKFLSKQELKFKLELKELQKRFMQINDSFTTEGDEEPADSAEKETLYRKPLVNDPAEILIKGRWVMKEEFVGQNGEAVENPTPEKLPQFIPNPDGDDVAVAIGARKKVNAESKKKKYGIQVLMSNDPSNENNVNFSPNDEPVSDRDLYQKGIIWINSVNPIIVSAAENKDNKTLLNDTVANYVFLIIAQYHAQKEFETQMEDDRGDPFLIFRKHYFSLQKLIREDNEVRYFEN